MRPSCAAQSRDDMRGAIGRAIVDDNQSQLQKDRASMLAIAVREVGFTISDRQDEMLTAGLRASHVG